MIRNMITLNELMRDLKLTVEFNVLQSFIININCYDQMYVLLSHGGLLGKEMKKCLNCLLKIRNLGCKKLMKKKKWNYYIRII